MGISEKQGKALDRQLRALELRRAGLGYWEIARQLGYRGAAGAYVSVQAALRKLCAPPAEELRQLELERLDRLQLTYWPRALAGEAEACDRVLKIMQQRARLLGLEKTVIAGDPDNPLHMQFELEVKVRREYAEGTPKS
jgi:hypothetical protein